jgi:UPF0755 protein
MAYKYNFNRRIQSKPTTPKPQFAFLAVFLIILAIIAFMIFGWFNSATKDIPTDAPKGPVTITVESGNGFGDVGEKLVKEKVLGSGWSLGYLMQNREKFALQPGKYTITSPATPDEILNQMKKKSDEIQKKNISKPKAVVEITVKEGDTLDQIITYLAAKEIVGTNELQKFAQNPANFDRSSYPFLPSPLNCTYGDMSNCAKYYPEGYMYPDTYEFFQDAPASDVFKKFLDNFNVKVWSKVKDSGGVANFNQVITMASVIEKETGRPIDGVNDSNIGKLNEEKRMVAGVFNNRIKEGMKWGSDPTVSYGTGKNLCQSTLTSQKDCLYLNSPEVQTKYNTYENVGYPIGPITSPQLATIQAVLNPDSNGYLFFVADAAGRKYFADSGDGHEANIEKVKEINKQYR